MRNRITVLCVTVAVLLVGTLTVLAQADTDAALVYLETQQNADGGFGSGFSPESTVGSTADAVLAIVSVGGDPAAFDQGGNTPLTYLAASAPSVATGGDLAKLILALIATGADEDPRTFGGVDSVARLESMIGVDGRIGSENDIFVGHLLAILALSSAQRPIPAASVAHIKATQQENGAWAWDGSSETAADTNTTAYAVQALLAAGEDAGSDAVTRAVAYYEDTQNTDGGWPYQSPSEFGTATDANSTAVIIQALLAAAQDPTGADWTTAEGNSPLSALESFQNESGAFAWQAAVPDDNLLATVQALPALAGKALPFATMDVGEAAVTTPMTMPETGGAVASLGWFVVLAGLALAGGGYALSRRQ